MKPAEVYAHVPDLQWGKWEGAAGRLLERLGCPMTVDEVLDWSLGPGLDVGGVRMGKSRRKSYVRNMLAWLSVRGKADYSGGRWRRIAGS